MKNMKLALKYCYGIQSYMPTELNKVVQSYKSSRIVTFNLSPEIREIPRINKFSAEEWQKIADQNLLDAIATHDIEKIKLALSVGFTGEALDKIQYFDDDSDTEKKTEALEKSEELNQAIGYSLLDITIINDDMNIAKLLSHYGAREISVFIVQVPDYQDFLYELLAYQQQLDFETLEETEQAEREILEKSEKFERKIRLDKEENTQEPEGQKQPITRLKPI
jgi:hypothetical protein